MTRDAAIVQMKYAVNKETVDNSNSILVGFGDLPDACLILIWKFIALEFAACKSSEVEDQFVDLKSMASVLRVTTKTKETFQSGQGWLLCAKALRNEYIAKSKQCDNLDLALDQRHSRGAGPLVFETRSAARGFLEELIQRRNQLESRCNNIKYELLPKVNDLVVENGGEKVKLFTTFWDALMIR
jgi:hypothetical protein